MCSAATVEKMGSESEKSTTDECAEAEPFLRRGAARADAGVEDHVPGDPIRSLDCESQPDGATPILDDNGDAFEVELVDEALD